MKFVDLARITVRGGDGGSGIISFRREKYIPKGGPDGGNGGRGGDVVIRAHQQLSTLLDFQYRRNYRGENGGHGSSARRTGRSGQPEVILVPVGTLIKDALSGEVIADLTHNDEEWIIARGGRGGRGNAEFATATNQAPRHYEPGEDGAEREIELELKLLADIGLVGLPNAGKSTLISVISAARPKIADYPFTTLVPNLGIVRVGEGKGMVVADIPGLIEGAHLGKGLGIHFLRHVERTKALVFLLDSTRTDVQADYEVLVNELRAFNDSLARRPRVIALTKWDAIDDARAEDLQGMRFGRVAVHRISAVAGLGIAPLVADMWRLASGERVTAPIARRRAPRQNRTPGRPSRQIRRKPRSSKRR